MKETDKAAGAIASGRLDCGSNQKAGRPGEVGSGVAIHSSEAVALSLRACEIRDTWKVYYLLRKFEHMSCITCASQIRSIDRWQCEFVRKAACMPGQS